MTKPAPIMMVNPVQVGPYLVTISFSTHNEELSVEVHDHRALGLGVDPESALLSCLGAEPRQLLTDEAIQRCNPRAFLLEGESED